MIATLDHRGREAFADVDIVDDRLRARQTRGRWTKPGQAVAVSAMDDLMRLEQLSERLASRVAARVMVNVWLARATCRADLERLNFRTLAAQLRIAHHRMRSHNR
jgi:hypothetical protein